jgi:hypothetical protein
MSTRRVAVRGAVGALLAGIAAAAFHHFLSWTYLMYDWPEPLAHPPRRHSAWSPELLIFPLATLLIAIIAVRLRRRLWRSW